MAELDLFDALDLPEHVRALQTLYWEAKREWQKLEAAYHVVLGDMLVRTGDLQARGGAATPAGRTPESGLRPASPEGGS